MAQDHRATIALRAAGRPPRARRRPPRPGSAAGRGRRRGFDVRHVGLHRLAVTPPFDPYPRPCAIRTATPCSQGPSKSGRRIEPARAPAPGTPPGTHPPRRARRPGYAGRRPAPSARAAPPARRTRHRPPHPDAPRTARPARRRSSRSSTPPRAGTAMAERRRRSDRVSWIVPRALGATPLYRELPPAADSLARKPDRTGPDRGERYGDPEAVPRSLTVAARRDRAGPSAIPSFIARDDGARPRAGRTLDIMTVPRSRGDREERGGTGGLHPWGHWARAT